jgi:hypothetical protein
LGRLRTLAILASFGASGQTTFAESPEDPKPPVKAESPTQAAESPTPAVSPTLRPEPPVPPLKYLEAGVRLFNQGRYDLASKYLVAAQSYRDKLTVNERVVLDVYREKFDEYSRLPKEPAVSTTTVVENTPVVVSQRVDSGVVATSTAGGAPVGGVDLGNLTRLMEPFAAEASAPAPRQELERGTEAWRDTADNKQKGRWMLRQAREQIFRGQLDAAAKTLAAVQGMSVRWGFFDDSPAKVADALSKAREKSTTGAGSGSDTASEPRHDRRTARARLREARAALAAGEVDKAEAIAREVKSWGLRPILMDDTPDKVAVAVSEVRRREAVRNSELMLRSYVAPSVPRRVDPISELQAPVEPPPGSSGSP